MSQLILDDQLDVVKVLPGLRRWVSAIRMQELRPGERILDDRVPEILMTCQKPTFVTIDAGFWNRNLCHPGYCIVFAEVDFRRQQELPSLLRKLFRHPAFKSHAQRMGKVIRLSHAVISYWEARADALKHLIFRARGRKRKRRR